MQRINEVITKLDEIIHEAKIAQSPLGYFAAIYRQMTIAIRDGILNGTFENGSRMEQLDVRFAGRYFAALEAWQQGKPCSASWQKAFDAAKENRLTVLQHILLGINAHINLDLSIATAETRPGEAVLGLRDDFNKVNDIIAALTNQVQDNLANIWLPFRWLDFLLRTEDEGWIHFSITTSREIAWKAATLYAFAPQKKEEEYIAGQLDAAASLMAEKIIRPGRWIGTGLYCMTVGEKGSISEKIDMLV